MKSKTIKIVLCIVCGILLIIVFYSESSSANDYRQQIVEVALGEEGTIGGAKYRTWYTGTADGAAWCASFVSWCANECDLITGGVIPKFQSCDWGVSWFRDKGEFYYTTYYDGEEYIPLTGDLIFFAWGHNKNDSTHVGIVQYVEDDYVITIEGNTTNSVATRKYSLSDTRILGYAVPNYSLMGDEGDFSGSDNAEIAWNYFQSLGCSDYTTAGIVGTLQWESGIDPTKQQNGGSGIGIAQWTYGESRYLGLLEYAAYRDSEWTNLEIQLQYVWYELNGGDSTTYTILNRKYGGIENFKNAESIEWAVEAFTKSHERPGIPHMEMRIQYAYQFYDIYSN